MCTSVAACELLPEVGEGRSRSVLPKVSLLLDSGKLKLTTELRMISNNPKSIKMFRDDLTSTYARIASRTKEMIAEETTEREQIQLVAEDPSMQITFNLPDGPPPDEIRMEGEGAETMDVEQVRAFLQMKWEVFEGFSDEMRKALRTEKLEEVNKVLAGMKVAEAEEIVEQMQEGGMLSFR